jgi:hypothetical protein
LSLFLAGFAVVSAQAIPPAALYTDFEQPPAPAVMDSLRTETDAIMARLGIDLTWRPLAEATGSEVSVQLAVIRFLGKCEVTALRPHRVQPGALGWTHESDGLILPFGAVDCDRIRSFLQADLLSFAADQRELIFGRAVGRVLAHELYHIFTRSRHHSPEGIGKAAYATRDLLAGRFVFDASESTELRNGQLRNESADMAH